MLTSVASLLVGVALFGAMIYLPQFLQIVKGMTPTESGADDPPDGDRAVPQLDHLRPDRRRRPGGGRRSRWWAWLLVAVGLFLLSRLHVDSSALEIGVDIAIVGAGLGA